MKQGRWQGCRARPRALALTLLGPLLGVLILLVGVAYLYRMDGTGGAVAAPDGPSVAVYVVNNGFHTDLVLPRNALEARPGILAQAVASDPLRGDWIYVGWGDARFFIEEGPIGPRWRDGLRALFGRDNPAVLMVRAGRGPERVFAPNRHLRLDLTPGAYGRLLAQIEAGMVTDKGGRPVLTQVRMRDGTHFYAHQQRFWIGHMCNHWVLETLHAAGLTVWPWRVMTAGQVMRQARLAQKAHQTGPETARLDLRPQAH